MASRRVLLVGHHTGPWIDTSRVTEPVLKIRGLQEGQKVQLEQVIDNAQVEPLAFRECGEFKLKRGQWARVHATGEGRFTKLICEIVSQRIVDALHST